MPSFAELYGEYGVAPLELLRDRRCNVTVLKVFLSLSSFQGNGQECYPGVRAIAKRAGVSKSAISHATDVLEKIGVLDKHSAHRGQSNTYVCHRAELPIEHRKTRELPRTADGRICSFDSLPFAKCTVSSESECTAAPEFEWTARSECKRQEEKEKNKRVDADASTVAVISLEDEGGGHDDSLF